MFGGQAGWSGRHDRSAERLVRMSASRNLVMVLATTLLSGFAGSVAAEDPVATAESAAEAAAATPEGKKYEDQVEHGVRSKPGEEDSGVCQGRQAA